MTLRLGGGGGGGGGGGDLGGHTCPCGGIAEWLALLLWPGYQ